YKIGVCYLHLPAERLKAIPYLENAIKQTTGNYLEDEPNEKNAPEEALYYLGQAYHYGYRFDEAMEQFKKYREIIGKWNMNLVKEIDRWTESSKNAKELTAKPVECTITNLGDSVNCGFADYSPVIAADESMLAFTSRREGTGGQTNKTIHDDFFEDIFVCRQGEYGTWKKAKGISKTINTDGNEATIGLSADGQQLYVYRDDAGDGNIYISKLDGNYWDAPYKMEASNVNSKSWEPSACISADGNTLYFVSNRAGGLGGRDIYQCHRQPNRAWSEPENLGPAINTPYDEDAPFVHPDGITFFFSSTGHTSMGGFDVFYSTKVANNVWAAPINMGYPINTTDDDIYFVTSSDGRRAYYSSFRPEGKGEKDIYMVSLQKAFVQSVAILVGYLKNRDGSPIPKNSLVTTKGKDGQVFTSKPNEATGKFIQSLLPMKRYEITIETNNNKIYSDTFFLPQDSSYQNLGRSFFQKTIMTDDTTHLFSMSMNKIEDLSTPIQMVPMDGIILLSRSAEDPADNISVQMLNSQGNLLASALTDSKGKFKFQNIPSGQNYILKIDDKDPILKTHTEFFLAANDGKVIMPSTQEGRFFLFKNISPDINKLSTLEAKDTAPAYTAMRGKLTTGDDGKRNLPDIRINLLDENGKVIRTKTTDKSGHFSFENLPSDRNYTISIKEDDPSLKGNKNLYLVNQRDELIIKVAKITDYFVFKNLPADLNKLSVMEVTDLAQLVEMKGRLLKSSNATDGIGNLEVNLVDRNGKVIQRTRTNPFGIFKFEKLSSDNNYTITFNENDVLLTSLKKIYLSNEADKVVKVIDLNKKAVAFINLPADLMALVELKEAFITPMKENPIIIDKGMGIPDDKNYDFVVYFPYNKKEIDISIGSFLSLMEKVATSINAHGNASISIVASSSAVPTKTFTSNEDLATARANEIKDKVRASMSLRNLDPAKISYDISAKVQGPEYKNDAVQNRKEYEKWQFVKVIVK
ncbi:MAG: hypothetical protein AABZ32_03040, partial [Bacteroidota bacterium]